MTKKEMILDILRTPKADGTYKGTEGIAYVIAAMAHNGQYRDNGVAYINHPRNCVDMFYNLMTIRGWSNERVFKENSLPYNGIAEVAYLHDVVEDTELSHQDIKDIFQDRGYGDCFDKYIDEPLKLITHDKSESYDTYIDKVLTNQTAALVKMFDLSDNMNLFGLKSLNEMEIERTKRYMNYFKRINDAFNFLDRLVKLRSDLVDTYDD